MNTNIRSLANRQTSQSGAIQPVSDRRLTSWQRGRSTCMRPSGFALGVICGRLWTGHAFGSLRCFSMLLLQAQGQSSRQRGR